MYSLVLFSIALGITVQTCQGLPFDKLSLNDVQRFEKELTNHNNITKLQKTNNDVDKLDGSFKGDTRLKELAWSDCSGSSNIAKVFSVTINPDPPQKGAALTIGTKLQLYQQVNGGTVYFNIKYLGYILVLKETMDLCDLAAEMEVSCPLSSGVYEQYVADTFPDYAYSGQYSGTVKAVDDSNNELACVNMKFTV